MYFEETYFNGEEKEGFYIKPMIKRAWAAQLEILSWLDAVCTRHNIEYFADWGTLLGAIRHGGFIPWDDDMDIGMKRMDYERFLKIAPDELPAEWRLRRGAERGATFSRVLNAGEYPLQGERLLQFHGFPYMAGIDIFPIDYVPLDKAEEETLLDLYRIAYILAYDWDKKTMSEEERAEKLGEIELYCNMRFTNEKPYKEQLWALVDRIGAMYWDTAAEAKEVTTMYMLVDEPAFRIPVSCYEQMIRVPFENTTIPVPVGYEQILRVYYGDDYMTPMQGGSDHEYPYYKTQQKNLMELYEEKGVEMPEWLLE